MRANLTDTTNPNAVTKNSGHTLKIHLIAVGYLILSLEITYSLNTIRQAELFNNFFYDQFSTKSNYSIDVDFSSDDFIDFKFDENKII